ncbi:hypothetical protein H8959_022778 [Pygathrix nigripes]
MCSCSPSATTQRRDSSTQQTSPCTTPVHTGDNYRVEPAFIECPEYPKHLVYSPSCYCGPNDVCCSSAASLNPSSAASEKPLSFVLELREGPDGRENMVCGNSSATISPALTRCRPLFL